MAILTVIWEKWIEFKHEWFKITTAAIVSPLLYMIALGWGLGAAAGTSGRPYIDFLVPGVIALSTMNSSFNATANPLNIQRLFEHSFEQIIISPTPIPQYIIGQMLGGALRGVYGGCLVLLISLPFGATMSITPLFFLIMLINGMAFSALGVLAAILATRHADISRFSTYVILPMTFLCNTFFPVENLPAAVKIIIDCLPLTHSSGLLRSIAYGEGASLLSIGILVAYLAVFMLVSTLVLARRKNL